MSFKGIQFFQDYDIDYVEEGKNVGRGWVGLQCPRCHHDPSTHLGFNPESGAFSCWRCGRMSRVEAVKLLAGVDWSKAYKILRNYDGAVQKRYTKTDKEKDIDVEFPRGTLDYFPKKHRKYLKDRNFDPDYLINTWDLKATGKAGPFKYRIIAPIYYKNTLMSYQGRDITDKSDMRYKACPKDFERRHHKYCLYGIELAVSNNVLVVEGITDVWRMGMGSVCTFGTRFTDAQVLLLYHHFDRIFVWFDETEEESQLHADHLVRNLNVLGKDAEQITLDIEKDPADLSNKEAGYIMRDLLIK